MQKTLVFHSYSDGEHEEKKVEIPEVVNNLYVAYDGGRLTININNEEIFSTMSAGNDCAVTINSN